MNKRNSLYLILAVVIIGAGGLLYFFSFGRGEEKEIHHHAGFQVYVNDKLQDFLDLKYMHIKPCGGVFHREDEQIEKAHLHDNVEDVVHVHRQGAVWGDLFKNLNWEIPTSAEFVGYLNGNRREDILVYPILPYDSVVFFSGPIRDINTKLQARVTDDHMKEVETRSKNCGN